MVIRALIIISLFAELSATAQEIKTYDFSGDWRQANRAVKAYIQKNFADDNPEFIGSGHLETHLPPEYQELNRLLTLASANSSDTTLPHQIDDLKDTIMARRIRPSFEIPCFFYTTAGNQFRIQGYSVLLNHAYTVMRLRTLVNELVSEEARDWFIYWQKGYPLLDPADDEQNANATATLFTMLDQGLQQTDNKGEYLNTAITVIKTVKAQNTMSVDAICGRLFQNYVDALPESSAMHVIELSPAWEPVSKESEVYYLMYARVNDLQGDEAESSLVISFNRYFELLDVRPAKEDISRYMKKE
jgi:hypothetical protein